MKIFLFGNRGYASEILENFVQKGEEVVGVCGKARRGMTAEFRRRLVRLFNRDDNSDFIFKDPFADFEHPYSIAKRHRIPVFDSRHLGQLSFLTTLRELAPDLIIVAGFHRLIPTAIFDLPKIAAINLHPSLLPRHRGGTPNRWVIRNGEPETGVTAHFLKDNFDTGDIIVQKALEVKNHETWGELELRISGLMVEMANCILRLVQEGNLRGIPQDGTLATYEPPFHGDSQVIDWYLQPEEVLRVCAAVKPKSSGITFYKNIKLCVWDAEIEHACCCERIAGRVIKIDSAGDVIVSCGKQALRIKSFLVRGSIVPAAEIARRNKLSVGDFFGNGKGV